MSGQVFVSKTMAAGDRLDAPADAWVSIAAVTPASYPVQVTLEGETGIREVYVHSPSRWRVSGRTTLSPQAAVYAMVASNPELLPEGSDGSGGFAPPASASYGAAQSSTTNIPTLATDGVDVTSRNGVRADITGSGGSNVTAGVLVWWFYDPVVGQWFETPVQDTLVTGRGRVSSNDFPIGVRTGRMFAELRNATCVNVGSFSVTLLAA